MKYGETLKQKRLEQNIDLEDVAYDLKIGVAMLKKIEGSDSENLPKPAFAKGLIRTYATYLKCDPKQILSLYEEGLSPEIKTETKVGLSEPFEPRPFFALDFLKDKFFPLLVLTLIALAGFVVFSFLKTYRQNGSGEQAHFEVQPSEPEKVATEDAPAQIEAEPTSTLTASKPASPEGVKESVVSARPAAPVVEPPAQAQKANVLVLHPLAHTSLYIKTNLDAKPVRATLVPDKIRRFKFESAEIKFKDAGAVNAILNGVDLGTLGTFAEEKTILFPSLEGK